MKHCCKLLMKRCVKFLLEIPSHVTGGPPCQLWWSSWKQNREKGLAVLSFFVTVPKLGSVMFKELHIMFWKKDFWNVRKMVVTIFILFCGGGGNNSTVECFFTNGLETRTSEKKYQWNWSWNQNWWKNINEIEAETRTGEKMSMKMKLKPELVKEMS